MPTSLIRQKCKIEVAIIPYLRLHQTLSRLSRWRRRQVRKNRFSNQRRISSAARSFVRRRLRLVNKTSAAASVLGIMHSTHSSSPSQSVGRSVGRWDCLRTSSFLGNGGGAGSHGSLDRGVQRIPINRVPSMSNTLNIAANNANCKGSCLHRPSVRFLLKKGQLEFAFETNVREQCCNQRGR